MAFTKLILSLLTDSVFTVHGTGRQTRDVTYVGDAVAATVTAMASHISGRVFNVGGGSEIALSDAISILEGLAGKALRLAFTEPALGDPPRTAADIALIRRTLGWGPQTCLREGLEQQLKWARAASATGHLPTASLP
jgi:nucleoside-diphosphate-sugar epimerase